MAQDSGIELLKRCEAVVRRGPAILRNLALSRLKIWPVSHLGASELRTIPTFCISLVRATAKRALITSQVRGLGLSRFEFLDAVDSRNLDRARLTSEGELDDAQSIHYHGRVLTLNEIACSLSHRRAYELIVSRGYQQAVIIEDDALFLSRRARRVSLSDVPRDFDCVFLNTFLDQRPPANRIRGSVYADASYSGSSAAYIVSSDGAKKLLAASRPVVHAADGLLGRSLRVRPDAQQAFRQHGAVTELTGYIIYPDCVLNGSCEHYHVSEVQAK